MHQEKLQALEIRFPQHSHIENQPSMKRKDWSNEGHPYLWALEDNMLLNDGRVVTLFCDAAYGFMALFINNHLEACGKDFIMSEDQCIVGLGLYYVNTNAKLYRRSCV